MGPDCPRIGYPHFSPIGSFEDVSGLCIQGRQTNIKEMSLPYRKEKFTIIFGRSSWS